MLYRSSRLVLAAGLALALGSSAFAGVAVGTVGLEGGFRWDAAPRTIDGLERSLDGGLRYSVQGGNYQAYRDAFTWNSLPSVADFQLAVEQSFAAWESVDPATNLGTDLMFVEDFATTATAATTTFARLGAEIDLLAADLGDASTRGLAGINATNGTVTLTSGTTNYGSAPITGADVTLNANPGAVYSLDLFRRLLTHELGHALGIGDVDTFSPNVFIDDNYDGSTSATALATLNNSWALLVDTADPSNSPLFLYDVPNADPGVDTPGVDILMESSGLGIGPNNPITNLVPLSNSDYGIRQFLYPGEVIPEPSSAAVLIALGGLAMRRRR